MMKSSKKLNEKIDIQYFLVFCLEAPIGVGPIIRVLQTRALPLGYVAVSYQSTLIIISQPILFVNSFDLILSSDRLIFNLPLSVSEFAC